ncbi:hypothetical protein C8A03DRAFT_44177 [Achaetomium macrosporum]|uniref:Uncharacterized protein n=1 Tax=Achaetomium macrosporum TaxID=79813 RepID=A0AAN7CB06_9PEZI|nr:hypothetical protein C8A03DRAFT_44177 [Achaetomium macrosporum]
MAQNNSSASAAGTERLPNVRLDNRSSLSPSSALQLFLRQRRRALRKTSGPNFIRKSLATSPLILDPGYSSSISGKVKTGTVNLEHLTKALVRHRLNRANPLALGRLYRRHRNPERALDLFLLRRLLWKSTRRPVPMDFIEHLRRIQADEPSSDEESGVTLTSLSTSDRSRRSSSTDSTVITVPDQPDDEAKVSCAKRKRNHDESLTREDVAGVPLVAKKTKVSVSEGTLPRNEGQLDGRIVRAVQPDPPKHPKAPSSGDEKAATAKGEQERPVKSVKREKGTLPEQSPTTTAGSVRHQTMSAPAGGSSSKAAATATPQMKKPVGQMEFFERRRHEILNDPLSFDDCVHDTTKPIPRHAAKSFAQYRRRQKGPTPPLEMSGAIGPADDTDDDAKPAAKGSKRPESLAKEVRKRAHQQKVGEKVQALKGKTGSMLSTGTAEEGHRAGSGGGKQAAAGKAANGKGKGKEKSLASTGSRQKPSVKQRGGRQQKAKYTKFN